MRGGNSKTRLRNPEIMQAAIDGVRDGLTAKDVSDRQELGLSTLREAFVIVREAPELVGQVLDGSMTIFKAHQIATRGEMHACPVCEGKGYVFRRRR